MNGKINVNNTVSFNHIGKAKRSEWDIINADHINDRKNAYLNVIHYLKMIGSSGKPPLKVSLFEHSLQTATRALHDNANEESIVCALLHDIGDQIAPDNHGSVAAAILEPFISAENHWMLLHHSFFQGYHFYQHIGRDRNARDMYKDHPAFDQTCHFCDAWDAPAFDPDYNTLPLSVFKPMVKRLFSKKPKFSNTAN